MADTVKKMPPSPAESCPAINGYETPAGVYPGKPDICYPNTPGFTPKEYCPVGGVILADGELEYNTDRRTVKVTVKNTGDRPIQIGKPLSGIRPSQSLRLSPQHSRHHSCAF